MATIKYLQELEANHLDSDHMIALVDYFKLSSNAAVTYLSLDLPILCCGWLQELVEALGFPLLLSIVGAGLSSGGSGAGSWSI